MVDGNLSWAIGILLTSLTQGCWIGRKESMTAVINLNHFRKTRKKAEQNTLTARNRVRLSRRKDDRRRDEIGEERSTRDLDGRCHESGDNEAAWDDYVLK